MSSRSARDRRAADFKAYETVVRFAFYLTAEYVGGKATSLAYTSLHDVILWNATARRSGKVSEVLIGRGRELRSKKKRLISQRILNQLLNQRQ